MSDRTAQPAPSKEDTKKALLEKLQDPNLSETEIKRIEKKLEVLKNHG